jgi:peptidyl-prolyl cis-trans isomerase A (cyclophilin A)
MKHLVIAACALAIAMGCDSPDKPTKEPPTAAAPATATSTGPDKPAATSSPKAAPDKPLSKELLDPALSKETAPDQFKVKFETTKGDFVLAITRAWAPNGADRFYNLVKIGYFDDIALFRAVEGFMVQFGIHGDPRVASKWLESNIPPDEVKESNSKGRLTYAMGGSPDTRSVQLFINYGDNKRLDGMGFAPIGEVVEGMDVVEKFYKGYGERTTREQSNIARMGNSFLRERYPDLDYIKSASLVDGSAPAGSAAPATSAAPPSTAAPATE